MAMNRDSQRPVLNRWDQEAMMEHQERMREIRMEIRKRKLHKRRVKAAKKAMKEFLVCTGAAIAMSAGLFCAFLFDPYQPPEPEPKMIQAINGDYYYLEEDYEDYLKEREEYMKEEASNESDIDGTLESMQELVGGYIETVRYEGIENVIYVVNEEGKVLDMKPNKFIYDGRDLICGDFFVAAFGINEDGEPDIVGLNERQEEFVMNTIGFGRLI